MKDEYRFLPLSLSPCPSIWYNPGRSSRNGAKIMSPSRRDPEIIADFQCHNAEVPTWHAGEQKLYWTDIPTGRMFRYDPGTGESEQIYQGEPVGGFVVAEDGSLLLFKTKGTIERWNGGTITTIVPEIPEQRDTRFNDAIVDPVGRVYSGTMATPKHSGCLFRLDLDGTLHVVLDAAEVPNGMGFNRDRTRLYYTDSPQRTIYSFEYDRETGDLRDRQAFLITPDGEGVPDGLTVDAEGCIWSARWDGGHLFRYSPEGEELLRIPFPARKVSSVTFGGADYTDIFVTTAGGNDRPREGEGAGAVFRLNLGIRGVPEFTAKLVSPRHRR